MRREPDRRKLWYCPICRDEDERVYGEMYWHRQHQIEMFPVCAKHRCKTIPCEESCNKAERSFFCADRETCPKAVPEYVNSLIPDYVSAILDAPFSFERAACMDAVIAALYRKNLAEEYGGRLQQNRQGLYALVQESCGAEYVKIALGREEGSENPLRCAVNGTSNVPAERIVPFLAALSIPPEKIFESISNEPVEKSREQIKKRLVEMAGEGYIRSRKSILAELGIRSDKLDSIARECGVGSFWRKNWRHRQKDTETFCRTQAVIYLKKREQELMNEKMRELKVVSRAEFIRYCIRKELWSL